MLKKYARTPVNINLTGKITKINTRHLATHNESTK
jgi:hypothetical protein